MLRLKAIRTNANRTQTDVANYLGISRQAYNHYELGKRQPDYETLLKLGEYFNCSVDYIIGAKDTPSPTDTDTELLRKYHALDERGQQLIQTMLEHEYEQAQKDGASITSPA